MIFVGRNPPDKLISSYKDVLSQPAPSLSHRQRLLWLQKRRTSGLWVQCDDCDRWRYLPNVLDSNELPNKWYCRLNPGKTLHQTQMTHPQVPGTYFSSNFGRSKSSLTLHGLSWDGTKQNPLNFYESEMNLISTKHLKMFYSAVGTNGLKL